MKAVSWLGLAGRKESKGPRSVKTEILKSEPTELELDGVLELFLANLHPT